MIDIRVGEIVKAWPHPEAEKLFCELINVGEDSPRPIASGLRSYYQIEELVGRKVLVVCNLKSIKLVGYQSFGMVLCAKNAEGTKEVEFVDPPTNSKVGERIFVQGQSNISNPVTAERIHKKKVWEKIQSKLFVNSEKIGCYDNKPLVTLSGCVSTPTLMDCSIS